MTTVTGEETRGGVFDYGGDPPAPVNVRLRVVQFFDDGTSREVWRDATLPEVFADWDASVEAQRDALATQSGERAQRIQEMEANAVALTEAAASAAAQADRWRAQYEQLLSEVEPV